MISLIYGSGPNDDLIGWRLPESLYTGMINIIENNFDFTNDTYNFSNADNARSAREYHLDVLKTRLSKESLDQDSMTTFLEEVLLIGTTCTYVQRNN